MNPDSNRSFTSAANNFNSQPKGHMHQGPPLQPSQLTQEIPRKKFTTRCRLFVGNLPNEMKEPEFKELFTEFGEINEVFLSGKGFGFLRLDTRAHAESAKEALDGKTVMGRQLRVRFAVHGATIRVKELSPVISNEMLYHTFALFGEVERAVHIVDERGKPTGEGIVEFERKASAQEAVRSIEERIFYMTANSRPLHAEFTEPKDEEDGLAERMLPRTAQTMKEREIPPHFADEQSFQFSYGQRWKELYAFEKLQRENLENDLRGKRRQLESDMEIAFEDYKAEKLREELDMRRRELERLEEAKRNRMRHMAERQHDMHSSPWAQKQPQRLFDDFRGPPNPHPPNMHPPNTHPPSGQGIPPLNAAYDGPNGRPVTFGREPKYFGAEDSDLRGRSSSNSGIPPIDPELTNFLKSFANEDSRQFGVQQSLNKSLGFPGEKPQLYPNAPAYGAPPPGSSYGTPPQAMFNLPPGPAKVNPLNPKQLGPPGMVMTPEISSYKPPPEKRRR